MAVKEEIQKHSILTLVDDITIFPKIDYKKAKKAARSYGDKGFQPTEILLLIDNTILRTAKQGMFLSEDKLYAFSSYSGKYSIALSDIKTLRPEIKSILRVPVCGIYVNENYFMSLPGLLKEVRHGDVNIHGIEILNFVLKSILNLTD